MEKRVQALEAKCDALREENALLKGPGNGLSLSESRDTAEAGIQVSLCHESSIPASSSSTSHPSARVSVACQTDLPLLFPSPNTSQARRASFQTAKRDESSSTSSQTGNGVKLEPIDCAVEVKNRTHPNNRGPSSSHSSRPTTSQTVVAPVRKRSAGTNQTMSGVNNNKRPNKCSSGSAYKSSSDTPSNFLATRGPSGNHPRPVYHGISTRSQVNKSLSSSGKHSLG